MSPPPSITKLSNISSTPRPSHTCNHKTTPPSSPSYFPPSHPSRTTYLSLRTSSTLLGLLQVSLAAAAFSLYSRRRWLDPCLSPAIASLIYSGIEVFSVLYWRARAICYTRAIYDGCIAVGFGVALGFFVYIARESLRGVEGEDGVATKGMGAVIIACMVVQIMIHAAVSAEGVKDWMRVRKEKRDDHYEEIA
ncbi:hypothetical protein QBC34DRAFT_406283 [Podospora aff. communis PSN243]|uniref:MARVEL domain-containing protein n=1 Tax=Podospora aff. communis PSN243 TaxID=3040156 RepID=A0AAV9GKZ8_9PEZI|nr:hypothetical protein QBC34DRAFT_406283 [Podospora aff. communis PSN243]